MACSEAEKEGAIEIFGRRADVLNEAKDKFISKNPDYTNNELGQELLKDTSHYDSLNSIGEKIISKCGVSENDLYGKHLDPEVSMAVFEASGKSIREVPFFSGKMASYAMAAVDHMSHYTSKIIDPLKAVLPDLGNYTVSKATETSASTDMGIILGLAIGSVSALTYGIKKLSDKTNLFE